MNRVLKKSMRVPRFGFTIEKQQKTVGRDVAFEVLTPARQRKSTLAVFENDNVVITKHVIVCPWCGKKAPAYYKNRKQYKEAAKWYRQYVEARIKWRNKRLGW